MDIKDYRQPMVTSIGVILGFLMGFLGQWVTEPSFQLASTSDYIVFIGALAGVLLLLASLYRMLSPIIQADVAAHYKFTLRLYMAGIMVAFASMVVSPFL